MREKERKSERKKGRNMNLKKKKENKINDAVKSDFDVEIASREESEHHHFLPSFCFKQNLKINFLKIDQYIFTNDTE